MNKKYLLLAMSGMMMAACSNEDLNSNVGNGESVDGNITFGITLPNPTRASYTGQTAAEKLGNNFIVYGFKYYTADEPLSAADVADTEKQQTVFDLYNVNYENGTENTTQSNTKGWEYVGYMSAKVPAEEQTIRYWDYAATGYVFSAVSGTGITAVKNETGATVYDKGWKVTVPAGGSITDLYTSARVPMLRPTPTGTRYNSTVDLTFYSLFTKVRFAMYETIPGYNVHIDRFYYDNAGSSTETNFAIDGNFRIIKSDAATEFTVSYYDNSTTLENRPKVTYDDADVLTPSYNLFGSNIQAQSIIGTTSTDATYDQAGGDYTVILPYQAADNHLVLRVDYTLKAISGNETIKVSGATAAVPASYTQWKENFAYTYIFKISDNTNGSTTPGGPEGLYPITFDGLVVADEEGVQETITSVTEPSITTYQKGEVVTKNNEYVAGDIYYSVMKGNDLMDIDSDAKVFEVYNCGSKEITEEQVEDYKQNELVLMPVSVTDASTLSPAGIPLADGSYQEVDAKKCYMFTAVAGKTYAIRYQTAPNIYIYKVVRVSGNEDPKPAFTFTANPSTTIATAGSKAIVDLKSSSPSAGARVMGAVRVMKIYSGSDDVTDQFVITEEANFTYSVQLTPETVAKGNPSGTYSLVFGDNLASIDIIVNIDYAASPANPVIAAGNATGKTVEFRIKGQLADGDVVNSNEGINVEKIATGKYKITADADVATGNYGITIGGEAVTVTVNHYDFTQSAYTLVWGEGLTAPTQELTLTPAAAGVEVASSDEAVVAKGTTDANGKLTIEALACGKTTMSYETAKCIVTVNQYELTSNASSFTQGTGKALLSLYENGKAVSARSNKVKVYRGATVAEAQSATTPETTGFDIFTNGKNLEFKNLVNAGVYRIDYVDGSVVLGTEIITVHPNI